MKLNLNNNLFRSIMSEYMERRGYEEVVVTPSIMDALIKDLFEGDPEPEISEHGFDPDEGRLLVMSGIKFKEKP